MPVQLRCKRPVILSPEWDESKFVYWPPSHATPTVRIPQPSGTNDSLSVQPAADEAATLEKCLRIRNTQGKKLWGKARWQEILGVKARSVPKWRSNHKGPMPGVHHYERGSSTYWIATWYESIGEGKRKKKAKMFSYGGPHSMFRYSEQAEEAAIKRRIAEEARWYSVSGDHGHRQLNRLD